jgi:hypothetical protein
MPTRLLRWPGLSHGPITERRQLGSPSRAVVHSKNRALAAADDTSKDWWFEINYFVATKPPGKDARYC